MRGQGRMGGRRGVYASRPDCVVYLAFPGSLLADSSAEMRSNPWCIRHVGRAWGLGEVFGGPMAGPMHAPRLRRRPR